MKYPAFYGTRRFIIAFTGASHLSLNEPDQSSPCPHLTSLRSILILSSHLRLGLPSGLYTSDFPSKIQYAPFLSPIRVTCPAHLIIPVFVTRMIFGEYTSLNGRYSLPLHSGVKVTTMRATHILTTVIVNAVASHSQHFVV